MTRTKLLSSNPLSLDNLFPSDEFKEVLSPLVEPETDKDRALVDEHLKVLGCYSRRSVSLKKQRVDIQRLRVPAVNFGKFICHKDTSSCR